MLEAPMLIKGSGWGFSGAILFIRGADIWDGKLVTNLFGSAHFQACLMHLPANAVSLVSGLFFYYENI